MAIGEDAFSECYYIRQINYGGTREEWEQIQKPQYWDLFFRQYLLVCTDGTFTVNAYA